MRWTAPEEVGGIRFSDSGLRLATNRLHDGETEGDVLRLWEAGSGRELAHLETDSRIESFAFASERALVLTQAGRCYLWDSTAGGQLQEVGNRQERAFECAVAGGGETLILVEESPALRVLSSGRLWGLLRKPPRTKIWHGTLTTAGRFAAAACTQSYEHHAIVAVWELGRGRRVRTYEVPETGLAWGILDVGPLALHPDCPVVALHTNGAVRVFGPEYEEERSGFTPLKALATYDLRFSDDGRTLEVLRHVKTEGRSTIGLARLDTDTGEVLADFQLPTTLTVESDEYNHSGVIAPNGDRVALTAVEEVEVLDLVTPGAARQNPPAGLPDE